MNDNIKKILVFNVVFLSCLTLAKGQIFENYIPQVSKGEGAAWYQSARVANFVLDLEDFPLSEIEVSVPADASVFIDGVMWFYAESDTSFTIPTMDLRTRFPSSAKHRDLAIYKRGIQKDEISVKKGIFDKSSQSVSDEGNSTISSFRELDEMEEFFFIAVLVIFLLVSLFKVIYPLVLSFIIRPGSVFSTEDFAESNTLQKIFSEEIILFLLIFNMLLMLLVMVSAYYLEVGWLQDLLMGDMNYLFFVWLSGTGVLLVISLVKFVWLKITAGIFGIGKFEFPHFFYMLRIISVILIAIFSILIVSITNDFLEIKAIVNHLLLGLFLVYIFGILMLYFIMTKMVSFKNYHLFSYLCTAELIPFLVISKLIVG